MDYIQRINFNSLYDETNNFIPYTIACSIVEKTILIVMEIFNFLKNTIDRAITYMITTTTNPSEERDQPHTPNTPDPNMNIRSIEQTNQPADSPPTVHQQESSEEAEAYHAPMPNQTPTIVEETKNQELPTIVEETENQELPTIKSSMEEDFSHIESSNDLINFFREAHIKKAVGDTAYDDTFDETLIAQAGFNENYIFAYTMSPEAEANLADVPNKVIESLREAHAKFHEEGIESLTELADDAIELFLLKFPNLT